MFRRLFVPVLALVFTVSVFARDDKKPAAVDEKAVIERMTQHATPGEFHKKLEPLVGQWTYKASFMMAPGAPAMELNGAGTIKWIMDGRFIQDDASGGPEMPFKGLGITGYDNHMKKYVSTWVDSMTTSIMYSIGEVDASGKVFTFHHEDYNPVFGQRVKARDVITVADNDHHQIDFYVTPPGGQEYKSGTIKYTRKK